MATHLLVTLLFFTLSDPAALWGSPNCPTGLSAVDVISSIATPKQQGNINSKPCNCLKQHASQLTAVFKCEAAVCCRSCDHPPL